MIYNYNVVEIRRYRTQDGTRPFDQWLEKQDARVRARVQTRLDRVEIGNFGDHKSVGDGVSELRIDFGPGYRVYYGRDGESLVILLVGGTKKRKGQNADIAQAQKYWRDYKREK